MSGGRDWTTREERDLRELYRRIGAQATADALGRSVHSVYWKARQLGVPTIASQMPRQIKSRRRNVNNWPAWNAAHPNRPSGRDYRKEAL